MSSRPKICSFLGAILFLLISMALSLGLYPFLENPLYAPRIMYGFGVWIACLSVSVAMVPRMYPARIVCFYLSYCFFAFTFAYGDALAEQIQRVQNRSSHQ